MPKISVIMGVYNGSKTLNRSIESILNQTFDDFELILCDDGSSDNSSEIIKNFISKDNRIKFLQNPINVGLSQTLNNCLEIATGDYVARMDDDDISHPQRFEKQVFFLDSHLEYAIIGTSRNLFDENGVWGSSVREGERTRLDIYFGKTFVHPSVMMRRNALLSVGGYSTGLEILRTEDFDLWCKLYEKGYKGYNLNNILFDYYEARDSYGKRKFIYRINEYKLKKKWRKKLNIPKIYWLYSYRPLLVGIFPTKFLMWHHKNAFKK